MGTLISRLEGFVRKRFKNLRIGGIFLAVTVIILSATAAAAIKA